jgi:glycosyltransferase involved in cell wall biosynthesis
VGTKNLVSVIIATFNRVRFVCEAIENVFEQTYKKIDLIVEDDGSKDDTPSKFLLASSANGDTITVIL